MGYKNCQIISLGCFDFPQLNLTYCKLGNLNYRIVFVWYIGKLTYVKYR